MRPTPEFIAASVGRDWSFQVRRSSAFDFTWHAHDDYELTLIGEGSGHRFTGDHVAPYAPGDLALFGPSLPHTYASTPGDGTQIAYVAHFRGGLLQRLGRAEEFRPIHALLERCALGVATAQAPPETVRAIEQLAERRGARQTLALLDVLAGIAEITCATTLASRPAARPLGSASADRLSAVIGYLDEHFARTVHRDELAAAVSMSPSSVSRLLRRQLGTTVTDYVNSMRVAAASRALVDTDRAIAEIAHDCGFTNLANFNRQFRRGRGMTPREYRRAFTASPQPAG